MSRILIRNDQGPMEILCGDESKWLCRCGLSNDQPWCDGSHALTQDEMPGKLYFYENGSRREIAGPLEIFISRQNASEPEKAS